MTSADGLRVLGDGRRQTIGCRSNFPHPGALNLDKADGVPHDIGEVATIVSTGFDLNGWKYQGPGECPSLEIRAT